MDIKSKQNSKHQSYNGYFLENINCTPRDLRGNLDRLTIHSGLRITKTLITSKLLSELLAAALLKNKVTC